VILNADTDSRGNPGEISSGGQGIPALFTVKGTNLEFNENADFYIGSDDILDFPDVSFDDNALQSRVEVKLSFSLYGDTEFPAASYTNPDVLLSSGLRALEPMSNANALNSDAPKLFAPLALEYANAQSRTQTVVVKDNRTYETGKLYYLAPMDCVAFLSDESIGHAYSGLGSRNLNFAFFRKCVRRPLSEILKLDSSGQSWEALNLAMCYTTDPPDTENMTVQQAASFYLGTVTPPKTMLDVYTQKGINLAQALVEYVNQNANTNVTAGGNQKNSGPQIIMFRYIPSILDIALQLEAVPGWSQATTASQAANSGLATLVQAGTKTTAGIIDGDMAVTYGFQQPNHQQFYDENVSPSGVSLVSAVVASSLDTNSQGSNGIPTTTISTIPIPAGSIGYATNGPAQNATPTQWTENSPPPSYIGENGQASVASTSGAPVLQAQSPFGAQVFNAVPAQAKISQVLIDKLVSVDLALKFNNANTLGFDLPDGWLPNFSGIPQFYTFNPGKFYTFNPGVGTFSLFSTGENPTSFWASIAQNRKPGFDGFTIQQKWVKALESSPQVLALNLSGSGVKTLQNGCYQILGSGGIYSLPYGHFIIDQNSTLTVIGVRSKSNRTQGGQIKIQILPGNAVTLSAVNPSQCELFYDNNSQTPSPPEGFSTAIPGGVLYFMTPFAEPTIERLLDVPLPVQFGGQLTQDQLNAQKNSAGNGPLLSQNNLRVSGDALNVSPDYLAASSGSDLAVTPSRPTGIAVGSPSNVGIWKLFEAAFFAGSAPISGFKTPNQSVKVIPGGLVVTGTYPNGNSTQPVSCLVYSLQVAGPFSPSINMQAEDGLYANALSKPAPTTALQPQVPGSASSSTTKGVTA
jgi:hypothetical protein